MAQAQIRREPEAAAKTARQIVEDNFDRFSEHATSELREEVRDLLRNRQLQDKLTDAWNTYLEDNRISQPAIEDLDDFMAHEGTAAINEFLSTEENTENFALLQTFVGDMAYSLRGGKIILTSYDAETHFNNYLNELRARTEDAVSSGLGTYVDSRRGPMQASVGTFELPDAEQATTEKIAELFNNSIGYTGAQTTVSGLPRGHLPAFIDAEHNRVSWSPNVELEQAM